MLGDLARSGTLWGSAVHKGEGWSGAFGTQPFSGDQIMGSSSWARRLNTTAALSSFFLLGWGNSYFLDFSSP